MSARSACSPAPSLNAFMALGPMMWLQDPRADRRGCREHDRPELHDDGGLRAVALVPMHDVKSCT